jgi:ABC-2 type transport system permease protein
MSALSKLTVHEFRLFLRDRGVAFVALILPVALLLVMGAVPFLREPNANLDGQRVIDIYVPILVGISLATLALNGVPGALAAYRETGVLRRLGTTPMRPTSLLTAQLLVSLVAGIVSIVVLVIVGSVLFDVPMPVSIPGYLLSLVLLTASLLSVGLVIAALAPNGRAAGGIGTIVYLPMLVLAGMWTPGFTPEAFQRVGDFTPLGAGVRAVGQAWFEGMPSTLPLVVMAVYAIGFTVFAGRVFRWE